MQQVTTLEDGGNYNKCVVAVDVLAHGVSDSWCVIVAKFIHHLYHTALLNP